MYEKPISLRREELALGPSNTGPRTTTNTAHITVCARKRNLSEREIKNNEVDAVTINGSEVTLFEHRKDIANGLKLFEHKFTFDQAYNEQTTNSFIYDSCIKDLTDRVFSVGGCYSCFAFGQTGSGKTYTMIGPNGGRDAANHGLWLKAGVDILERLRQPEWSNYELVFTFFEIHCNKAYDLLNNRSVVRPLETYDKTVVLRNLTEAVITNTDNLFSTILKGANTRSTAANSKNETSSRSHGILQMLVRAKSTVNAVKSNSTSKLNRSASPIATNKRNAMNDAATSSVKYLGRLAFIDLAGSERGADSAQFGRSAQQDGAGINRSLLALKECIRAMDRGTGHIPFRDSELTKILREYFTNENSHCVMIATIAAGSGSSEQSLNTLRYAQRFIALSSNNTNSGNSISSTRRTQVNKPVLTVEPTINTIAKSKPIVAEVKDTKAVSRNLTTRVINTPAATNPIVELTITNRLNSIDTRCSKLNTEALSIHNHKSASTNPSITNPQTNTTSTTAEPTRRASLRLGNTHESARTTSRSKHLSTDNNISHESVRTKSSVSASANLTAASTNISVVDDFAEDGRSLQQRAIDAFRRLRIARNNLVQDENKNSENSLSDINAVHINNLDQSSSLTSMIDFNNELSESLNDVNSLVETRSDKLSSDMSTFNEISVNGFSQDFVGANDFADSNSTDNSANIKMGECYYPQSYIELLSPEIPIDELQMLLEDGPNDEMVISYLHELESQFGSEAQKENNDRSSTDNKLLTCSNGPVLDCIKLYETMMNVQTCYVREIAALCTAHLRLCNLMENQTVKPSSNAQTEEVLEAQLANVDTNSMRLCQDLLRRESILFNRINKIVSYFNTVFEQCKALQKVKKRLSQDCVTFFK